ncbi:MAG: AAA family ATPase [Lentisphaeria bacterium]|nr:AAA family ATPase [Lentisphaeria bacterium]
MELFSHQANKQISKGSPLAARMRPRTLDEYIGQSHILATGRLLRRAIQADQLSSLIFYGPPGTGKTTLASVIANTTKSRFETLNAVLSGVKEIREVIQRAGDALNLYQKRTILFVDEVHRWNKKQQDALLPWVENGTIVLIGATTENPFFSVNKALLSRSRVFQLKPLTEEDLRGIINQALNDERGYASEKVFIEPKAVDHLVQVANGDARAVLNAIELAVETAIIDETGLKKVSLHDAEESIQQRAVLYDKEGDCHFDTVSAFIKSIRGSDPDATLYWMAKMVYAGEDPRYIFRRMIISSVEDIGMADPQAMVYVQAAADSFDRIGLPEGNFLLANAALYLATAPKSNSALAFFDALKTVREQADSDVPNHLRDAARDKEGFGHGAGYQYPHAYQDHWVEQQYLPNSLQGRVFYNPGKLGYEKEIAADVNRRREEQLAMMNSGAPIDVPPEILTFSPVNKEFDRWVQRTVTNSAESLKAIRSTVFSDLKIQRHHRILVVNDDSGLLTWESLRSTPEGGTWCLVSSKKTAEFLQGQAKSFHDDQEISLNLPHIEVFDPEKFELKLEKDLKFEQIILRNFIGLNSETTLLDNIGKIESLLEKGGNLALAEILPRYSSRPSSFINWSETELFKLVSKAEDQIYLNDSSNRQRLTEEIIETVFTESNFKQNASQLIKSGRMLKVTEQLIAQWFNLQNKNSYASTLKQFISADQLESVRQLFLTQLLGSELNFESVTLYSNFTK